MGQGTESLFLHLPHLIRSINDPEHPLTLEELNVVEQVRVQVSHSQRPRGQVVRESQESSSAPGAWRSLSSRTRQGIFGRGGGRDCCARFMDRETEAHRG